MKNGELGLWMFDFLYFLYAEIGQSGPDDSNRSMMDTPGCLLHFSVLSVICSVVVGLLSMCTTSSFTSEFRRVEAGSNEDFFLLSNSPIRNPPAKAHVAMDQ